MTELYTIKPIEWEQRANDFHAKNSILPIDVFLSLADLQTYYVWLGTTLIAENLTLTEAKLLAEQEYQKLIKEFLVPVTE